MDGQTEICLYFITVLLLNYIDITHTHTHTLLIGFRFSFFFFFFFSNFLISVTYAFYNMGFCVFVHGIFFFFFFFFFCLKLIIFMSGAVASLSWGVVTTRTCTVDLKKQVGKSNSATCQPRLAYTHGDPTVNRDY